MDPDESTPPVPLDGEIGEATITLPPPVLPPAAPVAPKPYPGFWQAVGLFALYSILQIVGLVPFLVYDSFRHGNMHEHPAVLAFGISVAGIGVVLVARKRLGITVRQMAGPLVRLQFFPPIALVVFALLMVEAILALWVSRRFPSLLTQTELGIGRSPWGGFLLIVIAAPLIEEAIFRGIFLRGFIARYGRTRGILLSAILFGAAHFSILKLAGMIAIGLILGWMYSELRSIWAGVFAHIVNNSLALLTISLAPTPKKGGDLVGHFSWAEPVVALVGVVLLVSGLRALRRAIARPESD